MWPLRQSQKQRQGQLWEERALTYLRSQGLQLVEANFRCKGGEIDLILREGDTVVFVEVRQREERSHGGAAASITPAKQRRLLRAAQVYLMRFARMPPCRIDVIAFDGRQLSWLRDAIQAV